MARRRGRGEGSITERSDGRWHARVDLGWENGKRRRKHIYGKTRAEVASKLTRALTDVQDNKPLPNEQITVKQYLATWLEDAKQHLRPKTYASYKGLIDTHIVP